MKWKRYQTKPTKVKTCQGLIILSWTAWLSNVFQDSKISIHGVIQRNLSILLLYCLEGPSELLLSWIIFYFCQKLIMLNVSWKRLTLLSMFWVRCTMTWIRQSIQSNFNWFNLYLLSPILHLNVLWNFTKHPPPHVIWWKILNLNIIWTLSTKIICPAVQISHSAYWDHIYNSSSGFPCERTHSIPSAHCVWIFYRPGWYEIFLSTVYLN